MNAAQILTDDMTLEEKLRAIDDAMRNAQADHIKKFPGEAPLDPGDLTQCEGCQ